MTELHRNATTPRELVLNVTLRCPLKCAHCCFSSDMFQQGHLSLDDAKLAITQAAQIETMRTVHFVGGDPFLHVDIMAEAFAHARAAGLSCGATTSAFWAKSRERADSVLARLVEAGLTEITISWDDSHAQFVRLSWIDNAVQAALALGLVARVAVTVLPGATLTAAVVRERLGLTDRPDVNVYETPVNGTGRAAERELTSSTGPAQKPAIGACHSVLRSFTVTHEGDIHACCGVLPHYEGLRVATLSEGGIGAAVERAYRDNFLKWLSFEGPGAVLKDLRGDDPASYSGVCEACDHLFRDPALLARARQRADERGDRIAAYETAYRAANLFGTVAPRMPADHGD